MTLYPQQNTCRLHKVKVYAFTLKKTTQLQSDAVVVYTKHIEIQFTLVKLFFARDICQLKIIKHVWFKFIEF